MPYNENVTHGYQVVKPLFRAAVDTFTHHFSISATKCSVDTRSQEREEGGKKKQLQKYLSGVFKKCLCLFGILQLLCRDLSSSLKQSGITATCECHQHQFTHGQCTLVNGTWYFHFIVFQRGFLLAVGPLEGGMEALLFQISTLGLTASLFSSWRNSRL